MFDVSSQQEALEQDAVSNRELYERLRDYIGMVVLVRHGDIERAGVLSRLSYRREDGAVYYSFDAQDRLSLSKKQHVAVRIDGLWKIIHRGSEGNREL